MRCLRWPRASGATIAATGIWQHVQDALDAENAPPPRAAVDHLELEPAPRVGDHEGLGRRESADLAGVATVAQKTPPAAELNWSAMGWASAAIERLQGGGDSDRPRGHSTTGRVNDGDRVTVQPLGQRAPEVGEIVLVRCRGHECLHLVKARRGDQFLIGNNRGGINGWVGRQAIFGVAIQVTG